MYFIGSATKSKAKKTAGVAAPTAKKGGKNLLNRFYHEYPALSIILSFLLGILLGMLLYRLLAEQVIEETLIVITERGATE